jgi:hypothetical protein
VNGTSKPGFGRRTFLRRTMTTAASVYFLPFVRAASEAPLPATVEVITNGEMVERSDLYGKRCFLRPHLVIPKNLLLGNQRGTSRTGGCGTNSQRLRGSYETLALAILPLSLVASSSPVASYIGVVAFVPCRAPPRSRNLVAGHYTRLFPNKTIGKIDCQ